MALAYGRLRTCQQCGAAVDPVDGGRQHEAWHLTVAAGLTAALPQQPAGSHIEQRPVIVNARSETIAVIDARDDGETVVAIPHHFRSHHPLPEEPPSKMVRGATPASQSGVRLTAEQPLRPRGATPANRQAVDIGQDEATPANQDPRLSEFG